MRSLLASVPLAQAEMNLLALEEEAAANGLQSPACAFEAAIRQNWQAKRSPHEVWWQAAGLYWGKERRNALIQSVTKWNGQVLTSSPTNPSGMVGDSQESPLEFPVS